MTYLASQTKANVECVETSGSTNILDSFSINHALITVTQEVAQLLQQGHLAQVSSSDRVEVIPIRAIAPEYRQLFTAESLTERESEVLQLIVDGYRNGEIAQVLYITKGTVKSHVCNILKKLCAKDRTQAAIRALRLGLAD